MPGRWGTSLEAKFPTCLDTHEGYKVGSPLLQTPFAPPHFGGHGCPRIPRREKIVSMEFMRKYIHVAKMIKPVLTQESASYIAEEYSRLRSQNQMNSDIARVSPASSSFLGQEEGN